MGIGPVHLILLLIIVLVVFGPSRLPTLGKSIGEAIRGFKKGLDSDEIDVTNSVRREQVKASDDETQTAQKKRDTSNTDA